MDMEGVPPCRRGGDGDHLGCRPLDREPHAPSDMMSSDSDETQLPRDQRCEHCGRTYTKRGIISHRRNCDWQDYDGWHPAADGDPSSAEGDDPPFGEGADPLSDEGAEPDDVEGADPLDEGSNPSETRTDGGETGLGLSGPPDDPGTDPSDGDVDDAVDGAGEETETVDCPSCDADTGMTPEDHEDGKVYRCQDCSNKYRWSA